MNIKSKCTEYKGVYFRSRLEVKWCMFFEYLGVRFEYEPASKPTTKGFYVPDFYFRSLKTWVEIKGTAPTKNELLKIKEVCVNTNSSGFIISGYPLSFLYGIEPHLANGNCYYITNKGVSKFIPLDEIYQILQNVKILNVLNKIKASSLMRLDFSEFIRYKKIEPAKAKFTPNKNNFIEGVKYLCEVFGVLNKRLK